MYKMGAKGHWITQPTSQRLRGGPLFRENGNVFLETWNECGAAFCGHTALLSTRESTREWNQRRTKHSRGKGRGPWPVSLRDRWCLLSLDKYLPELFLGTGNQNTPPQELFIRQWYELERAPNFSLFSFWKKNNYCQMSSCSHLCNSLDNKLAFDLVWKRREESEGERKD